MIFHNDVNTSGEFSRRTFMYCHYYCKYTDHLHKSRWFSCYNYYYLSDVVSNLAVVILFMVNLKCPVFGPLHTNSANILFFYDDENKLGEFSTW